MPVRVLTGLPATGKTSKIIAEMERRRQAGDKVVLILSSEHEELTRRENVRPGGTMGCRVPGKGFAIDHVVDTATAADIICDLPPGSLAVFDEAQYFSPHIVTAWENASARNVDILVGTPSASQLTALADISHDLEHVEVVCSSCDNMAKQVYYEADLVYPLHLCSPCYEKRMRSDIDNLLADVKESKPFPGELHTYQPFFSVDMEGWKLVRGDSPQRLAIIMDAVNRCDAVQALLKDDVAQPSFIDLGCCSGFFADGMATEGFRSAGVDVDTNFIDWAGRLAHIKGQQISYTQQDLHSFMMNSTEEWDVASTFATVQWVMAQSGYEAGIECFKSMFDRTRSICIVEMGYTSEDIYREKITDRPREIDQQWVMDLMQEHGNFASIEVHSAGENGIWRDIFVGFKEIPSADSLHETLKAPSVAQISIPKGHWPDDWVGTSFDVMLRALKDYSRLELEGWRPEGSGGAEIKISIFDEEVLSAQVSEGVFKLKGKLSIEQDAKFKLSISSTPACDSPGDERKLAFVLRSLKFS